MRRVKSNQIRLNIVKKEELQIKIKAAKKWGFFHVFIQIDDFGDYETYAVFDLNGNFLRSIHRKKLEEIHSAVA